MAETFTDSKGNVFPLNQFGRPQGYWDGNKFVFPQFGTTPAVSQPVVDPVSPVENVQPVQTPYRLPSSVREEQRGDDPTGGGSKQNQFGGQNNVTMKGGASLNNINMSPQSGALLGALAGRAIGGPLGAIAGSGIGGYASGRGSRGIGGDIAGSLLGTALFGPVGGLLGFAGGRMGDVSDMENVLNMGQSGQRVFWDTLGYGFGLGDSLEDQMSGYYGINQIGTDPFGAAVGHPTGLTIDEDDIGDIDPSSGMPDPFEFNLAAPGGFSASTDQQLDAFSAIADAFGGDDPDDGSMDSSSDDNTFGYGVF